MKLKVMKEFVFVLILFLFLLPYVSSITEGTCSVVTRAECADTNPNSYVVMGLTGITNSHGQNATTTGNYPYVLCCRFGTGSTSCSIEGVNKIVGLSSITNAHAENKSLTNYNPSVCYENIRCTLKSSCDTATENGVLSLSSNTNAHIGPYEEMGSYANKVCCTKTSMHYEPLCVISSAQWGAENGTADTTVVMGRTVAMDIMGTGTCDGRIAYLEVWKLGLLGDTKTAQKNVTFSGQFAQSSWRPLVADGITVNDNYYFGAGLGSPLAIARKNGAWDQLASTVPRSSNLKVDAANYCDNINSCADYSNELNCNSRSIQISDGQSVDKCGIAPGLNSGGALTGTACSVLKPCNCKWDSSTNICLFNQGTTALSLGYCGDDLINSPNNNHLNEECDVDAGTSVFSPLLNNCANLSTATITYNPGTPLVCSACRINILASGCTSPTLPVCGDGSINRASEQCDGAALGITTCQTLGFTGGTLSCNSSCSFDKSRCVINGVSLTHTSCSGGICSSVTGDGVNECSTVGTTCTAPNPTTTHAGCNGDRCVTLTGAGVNTCSASIDCSTNEGTGLTIKITAVDEDGGITRWEIVSPGTGYEVGDRVVPISDTGSGALFEVTSVNDAGGVLALELIFSGEGYIVRTIAIPTILQENTYCGDGIVSRNAGNFDEQCDPSDGPGRSRISVFDSTRNTCTDFTTVGFTGGALSCTSDCKLDYSECVGGTRSCGDRIVDTLAEECDNRDFQGLTCQYLGANAGKLKCGLPGLTNACKIDYSGCVGIAAGESDSYSWRTETITDCEEGDGVKTIRLTKLNRDGTEAESIDKEYPCPSYVQLPFFDFVQMIVAMTVIAGIYIVILFRKNKK